MCLSISAGPVGSADDNDHVRDLEPQSSQQTGTEEWQHDQAAAEIIKRNKGRTADDRANINTWLYEDHGCKPIVIQKSGNITINYLDTLGAPLDPDHLANAISLTCHFAGRTGDDRLNQRRRAYLSHYLGILYREAQQDWARRHAGENRQAQREACAIHRWHTTRMTADDTVFDAYTHLRDRRAANDGEVLEFIARIT